MKLTQVEAARLMAAHSKVVETSALWRNVEIEHRLYAARKRDFHAAERAFADLVSSLTEDKGE